MPEETTFGSASIASPANQTAVAYVRAQAERKRRRDESRIRSALRDAGISANVSKLCAGLRRVATPTINFHPDRIAGDGRTVAEGLLGDGIYRSQFETRISSGGITAYPGGDRDRWEERLFGGAYQASGVRASERPRYGGLDLLNLANGACPRFGSCHLRLTQGALTRATFFVGDSVTLPDDGGTLDRLEPVLAGLVERVARGDDLGRPLTVASLVDGLLDPAPERLVPVMSHALDAFLEAQIHGPITLAEDVAEIVIDPSFHALPTGEMLQEAADRYGVRVRWNAGSQLAADEIPLEEPPLPAPRRWAKFCGSGRAAALARLVIDRFATDGRHLDAAALGAAAVSVVRKRRAWEPWHDSEDAPTRLKDLWHILVVYGHAADPGMDIRPVADDDLPFLAEMALLASFPPGPLPDGAREMSRVVRWTQNWGRPGDIGVVAWRGGKRVGSAWCRVQDEALVRDEAGNPLPEIAIAVLPEERSRGVGGRLLAALGRETAKGGLPALSLTVSSLNPAHRLYERLGFVLVLREGDCLTMVRRSEPNET